MPSEHAGTEILEIAHVLFMDVVGFSRLPMDRQAAAMRRLIEILRDSQAFQDAETNDRLLRLPTGDGFALVFSGSPEEPVRCALEVSRALRADPFIHLRMGVHTGPIYRVPDINANRNVTGGGIIVAQRVMDCGDEGHILVSNAVAEILVQLSDWQGNLHDLGQTEVKHGFRLRLFNLYTEDAGNPAVPAKLHNAAVTPQAEPHPGVAPCWIGLAALLILAALASVFVVRRLSNDTSQTAALRAGDTSASIENPLANAQFTRFTDFEGAEHDAAISPDGRFVAFLSDRDGPFDIWLSQVGTGRFVNLTQGKDQYMVSTIRAVGFSGDGSEIWLHDGDAKSPLRLMPLMGGASRIFQGKGPLKMPPVNAAWAPDDARMVFHTGDPGDPMVVADRTGANARQIFVNKDPGMHNHWPAWSPDGRWIYFSRGSQAADQFDLWRIGSAGGEPEPLTHHNSYVAYATPVSQRTVLYVARETDGSGPWLWSLDVERKVTRRVSFGLEQYTSIAASVDGRRLVATVSNPTASLWSLPIVDRLAEERDVKPFTLPTVRALAPRFGGTSLFYLSSRGTGDGLWRYRDGQGLEIWRGADGRLLEPPAISPDGRRVAFVLRNNGKLRLHLLTADGADLQAAADTLDVRGAAGWSPDAKWVVAGGDDAQGSGLFKIPADGGAPVRIATGPAQDPVWSPDGSVIVYAGASVGPYVPLLATTPDGAPVDLPAIEMLVRGERARFLPNSKSLVYMQGLVGPQDFWMLDLATMKTHQLAHLTNSAIMRTFDITPDGRQIVFDRLRENSDIVLIDLPK